MIILITQGHYRQLVELDTTSGEYRFFIDESAEDNRPRLQGWYGELNGFRLFFYSENGALFLRVDSRVIELNEDAAVYLESPDERHRRLVVIEYGEQIINFIYARPIIDPPLSLDPTPHVSEEDFDFGLFIHNVVNDPERKSLVTRVWGLSDYS